MALTVSQVVTGARRILQDTDADNYRHSNEEMLDYFNQALKRIAVLRPDLFIKTGVMYCTPNEVEQRVPGRFYSIRLVEVFEAMQYPSHGTDPDEGYEIPPTGVGPTNRRAVLEVDRSSLDAGARGWRDAESRICTEISRFPRSDNIFLLSTPSPEHQFLSIAYAKSPKQYTLEDFLDTDDEDADVIETIPDAYLPVMIDATVFVASSLDDEAVNSRRAELFYRVFTDALGVSTNVRNILDVEAGGHPSIGEYINSARDGPGGA